MVFFFLLKLCVQVNHLRLKCLISIKSVHISFSGQTFSLSFWVYDRILSKLITFPLASGDTIKSHFNFENIWPLFVDLSADVLRGTYKLSSKSKTSSHKTL